MVRATAIYVAFFLVVAAGAYVMTGQAEHSSGLWAVSIFSSAAAIFLIILGYLPAKS